MSSLMVRRGSIYSPGWHVAEEISERCWRVLATFEKKSDAEDFLSAILSAIRRPVIGESEDPNLTKSQNQRLVIGREGTMKVNTVEMYQQYSQAVDDEQGMRLVGCTFNESDIARVGIADTPGAYLVSRWVTEWERDDAT